MNCTETRRLLTLELDGELGEGRRSRWRAISECKGCR